MLSLPLMFSKEMFVCGSYLSNVYQMLGNLILLHLSAQQPNMWKKLKLPLCLFEHRAIKTHGK
jgi:hypothetical protein